MTRTRTPLLALVTALLLAVLTACGAGSDDAGTTGSGTADPSGAFPVTVTGTNGEVTVPARPTRVVSMSATGTEMLFGMGAGDQVVAVDSTSTYPAQAPVTDLSAFTPSAEAVAGYTPDLVVVSDDLNGLLDGLTRLRIPTLQLAAAASLEESYAQMAALGTATGHVDEATALAGSTRDRISAAVASAPASSRGLSVYHELDPTYYTVTSQTFLGQLYALFGLRNIADTAPDPAGGYPQLSAEAVAGAAPEVVVLADTVCCGVDAASFAARPVVGAVPAVAAGRVLAADDDVASRWGPRTADLAEAVAATLAR
ncbi:helical backbone metal receptor [Rhodococcus aerolatus]